MAKNSYRKDLDILKGLAIIAVVLYHMGLAPGGYLGVDTFFVINGFLIVPKVVSDVDEGKFKYFGFLEKRIVRLLPLMLMLTALVLFVGYWGMLPDDYENLSQSVVAANFLSGNILGSITAKNYWEVWNDYKPLMHTWYIGVLFEFYLLFPLVVLFIKWITRKIDASFAKCIIYTIVILTVVSFILYLCPAVTDGNRFYLLPYRFFELSIGGLAGIWIRNKYQDTLPKNNILSCVSCIGIITLLYAGGLYFVTDYTGDNLVTVIGEPLIPKLYLLIIMVVLTLLFVMNDNMKSYHVSMLDKVKFIGLLGMMSYSIYVWHQPILAFYRYYYSVVIDVKFVVLFVIIVLLLSYLTYYFVEKKIVANMKTRIVSLLSLLLINGTAFYIYMHAGVVRDVPELDIKIGEEHRNMFAEYNDRIYQLDKPFEQTQGKIKVLCMGNSFARDWCNILLESKIADKIDLTYVYKYNKDNNSISERIKESDYIFIHSLREKVPDSFWKIVDAKTEVWGIGTKNFGDNNGQIYKNRNNSNYYEQTVNINPNYFRLNDKYKMQWEDHYVDLLRYSLANDSSVVVFSDDHRFLSQDCRHLTQAGARYFAQKVEFEKIFHNLE